jgi:4-hydroxy-tetrahydrodipicolinate synthase
MEQAAGDRQQQSWPQGIWAAVPTPFLADQSLDLAGIAENVRQFRDALGLAGLFCNGLMGEGWSPTMVSATDGSLPIGVVTTHASLPETLELSHRPTSHHFPRRE